VAELRAPVSWRRPVHVVAWEDDAHERALGFGVVDVDLRGANPHMAEIEVEVRPEARGKRLGSRLLAALLPPAQADERTLLLASARRDTAGAAFLTALGAEERSVARKSALDVTRLDRVLVDEWITRAPERASGYELRVWTDATPPDLVAAFAEARYVMGTAPLDDLEYVEERITPEQQVEQDAITLASGNTWFVAAAIDTATGAIAGYTVVFLTPSSPELAHQGDTGVWPEHRDRGLGRWLKAAMLRKILDEWPAVRWITTWNAGSNEPMLAINVALGFEVMEWWGEWQVPTATVAAALYDRV
jgi:GNAT superfamily N-acetyltransferase